MSAHNNYIHIIRNAMYTSIYNIVIICADRPRIINDVENKRLYTNILFIYTYYIFNIFFPCPFRLFRRCEFNTAACAHAKKKKKEKIATIFVKHHTSQ